MFSQSLGVKIIVFVAIVLIVAFAIFVYAYLKLEEKQMLTKSREMGELLFSTMHSSLREAMLEGKPDKIPKIMESYGSFEKIDQIRIFQPESGIILADANKANVGHLIEPRYRALLVNGASQSALFSEGKKQVLSIVVPILNEPDCHQCHDSKTAMIGALNIDMSVEDIFEEMTRNRSRMIGFALLTVIGMSLVIGMLVIRLVSYPIKKLVRTMHKMESGDLTAEADMTTGGELGELGRSFNSMTARLRGEIERLGELHEMANSLKGQLDLDERARIAVWGIAQGLKFDRTILLLVNSEEQTLEGKVGIGVLENVVKQVKIPLDREHGILAETVLDAKPFYVPAGIYDMALTPEKVVKCWEFHQCGGGNCLCWFRSRMDDSQVDVENKVEMCGRCPIIHEVYGKEAMLVLLMFGSKAFATVPLMAQNRAIGVIAVDNLHTGRPITDEDIKGLSVFAAQAGMAIENAKLYKRLANRVEAADEALKQKIIALTEMKRFNDRILQNMSNGLITIDTQGRILYLNAAAEAILGYKAQEVQGEPIQTICRSLEPLISETLQEQAPTYRAPAFHEIAVHTQTERAVVIEVSVSSLKNDVGKTTGAIVIFTDLSERKEMEEQIRRADKLATLGHLAAGIAHEIRNPLAGISGAVQILKDEIPGDDPLREVYDEIAERIEALETSIRAFLQFARPAPLQFSPTDINEVIQSVLFLIRKQAETQGVSIVEAYDNHLPIIMADSEQIQQVILNLALNALQAINGQRGRVCFKTSQSPNRIVIEISDTGVGIPPEKLNQIFTPYFTTKSEGTGLGLSIAQRIIEEHGGSISVESEVGVGTTFRIDLKHG